MVNASTRVVAHEHRARRALVVVLIAAVLSVAAVASGTRWVGEPPTRARQAAPRVSFAGYDAAHRALEGELAANRFGYDREYVLAEVAKLDAAADRERARATPDARMTADLTGGLRSGLDLLRSQVSQWRRTYGATDENRVNASGTDAEAALIAVSGGAAQFSIDDACAASGSERGAIACVTVGATVHVPAAEAGRSNADLLRAQHQTWTMVMTHEYAHVVQNRYRDALQRSPDFDRLFGHLQPPSWYAGPYELEASAECMATTRMPGYVRSYPVVCTPEQLAMAQRIWNGDL